MDDTKHRKEDRRQRGDRRWVGKMSGGRYGGRRSGERRLEERRKKKK